MLWLKVKVTINKKHSYHQAKKISLLLWYPVMMSGWNPDARKKIDFLLTIVNCFPINEKNLFKKNCVHKIDLSDFMDKFSSALPRNMNCHLLIQVTMSYNEWLLQTLPLILSI